MTKQFERLYKGRTAVERVNARLKLYWGADDGNVVGARRFHAMVGVVMLVTIRKHSQVLDFTGVTPRFRIVT